MFEVPRVNEQLLVLVFSNERLLGSVAGHECFVFINCSLFIRHVRPRVKPTGFSQQPYETGIVTLVFIRRKLRYCEVKKL